MAEEDRQFTELKTAPSGLNPYVVGVGLLLTGALLTQAVQLSSWRGAMDERMKRAEADIAAVSAIHVLGGLHP